MRHPPGALSLRTPHSEPALRASALRSAGRQLANRPAGGRSAHCIAIQGAALCVALNVLAFQASISFRRATTRSRTRRFIVGASGLHRMARKHEGPGRSKDRQFVGPTVRSGKTKRTRSSAQGAVLMCCLVPAIIQVSRQPLVHFPPPLLGSHFRKRHCDFKCSMRSLQSNRELRTV
jgi:hypothetical protein